MAAAAPEPWNPDSESFPTIHELPPIPDAPPFAAWFWGKDDYLGRLNLLTPSRVKAASAEIKTGEMARTDLPLHVPAQPAFGREHFQHEIKALDPNFAYDDKYSLNTQSGTQWDGFRHVAHRETGYFYNWTKGADIDGPEPNEKASIHYWSQHGLAGRGVLLDYRSWATEQGIKYDAAEGHAITYDALVAVGKHQGLDIRPAAQGGDIQVGDILFVRSGFVEDYYSRSAEQNAALGLRAFSRTEHDKDKFQVWAGVSQEDRVRDWLHDCYFAAVGGDAPAFERFPSSSGSEGLHAYILACWGMPLGEMIDLERVAELAKKNRRWTFFFTSAPANVVRGVSSHVNGTAIF